VKNRTTRKPKSVTRSSAGAARDLGRTRRQLLGVRRGHSIFATFATLAKK